MELSLHNKEHLANAIQYWVKKPVKIHTDLNSIDKSGFTICSCGKKRIGPEEIQTLVTPFSRACDRTCDDCKKLVKGLCPIVCVGCKEVIAYLQPGKDEDGFIRERGKTYHVKDCPQCNPSRFSKTKDGSSILAEKAVFLNKTKNIPLTHWDK